MDLTLSRPTLRDLPSAGFASSAAVWGVLVAYLVATKLLITYVFPVAFERGANQDAAFSWPVLAVVAVLGLAGIWLAHQTGFPAAIDPRIINRERLLYPALVGIGFGILTIVLDLLFGFTRTLAANSGNATFNVAFPGSVFVYTGGAISVEVLERIFPLPLLVWLISSLILRGRGQFAVFWILAPILALWEPVSVPPK